MLNRFRRVRGSTSTGPSLAAEAPAGAPIPAGVGWDYTAAPPPKAPDASGSHDEQPPLRTQILSLFADPRIQRITLSGVIRALRRPAEDVELALDAMVQSGEILEDRVGGGRQFRAPDSLKHQLESTFRDAALELGETALAVAHPLDGALARNDEDSEEPRLPVTAGLLSLFLPGTGQLLNGDVGRASLVFAVWSLAWITHLSPVWTFVCLYAGAEAFFTAKIRSMERKIAKDALASGSTPPALPPPKPSST